MTNEDWHELDIDLLSTLLLGDGEGEEEEQQEKGEAKEASPAGDESATLDGEERYHLSSIQSAVVIRQRRSQGLSFQLWPAASSLVCLLDRWPSALLLPSCPSQIRILELGSGKPSSTSACGGSLDVRQLRWGEDEDAAAPAFDLVVTVDVVYYEHLIDPLLRTLRAFIKEDAAFVMAQGYGRRGMLHTDPPLPENRVGVVRFGF